MQCITKCLLVVVLLWTCSLGVLSQVISKGSLAFSCVLLFPPPNNLARTVGAREKFKPTNLKETPITKIPYFSHKNTLQNLLYYGAKKFKPSLLP